MKMLKRLLVYLLLCSFALLTFSGCGKEDEESEEIELLEPVGVGAKYVAADYRNLYNYKVYSGIVTYEVTEIAFDNAQTFEKYMHLPGETVKKNETIIAGSTEKLDKQIEGLTEKIENLDKSYVEYLEDSEEPRSKAKFDIKYYGEILDGIDNDPSAENQRPKFTKLYQEAVASLQKIEQTDKEKEELYVLDRQYLVNSLNKLKGKRKDALLKANTDGVVMSVGYYSKGDLLAKDAYAAAVGDVSKIEIKTEFISKTTINRADEYYAFIDGERYEIEYVPIDSEEYTRLSTLNGTVYSSFKISDPEGKIKAGDFASIVLINDCALNSLSVPKDAVYRDERGTYVYVYKNDSFVETPVKTGVKDGMYIEITQGLNAGDLVMSDEYVAPGKKTEKLSKGTLSGSYSDNGYLFYPATEWIINPVEYGVTYLDELLVSQYEYVEKGQTVATIKVKSDLIEIERLERNIVRQSEELFELIDKNDSNGKNDRAISKKLEAIKDIQDTVDKMKADGNRKKVVAPYSGIITSLRKMEEGDIIPKDAGIAEISDDSASFIVVNDESGQLSYGDIATIEYTGLDGNKTSCEGMVVTANAMTLGKSLKQGYSLIALPSDKIGDIAGSSRSNDGWWSRTRFSIDVPIRETENVVLVPRTAVKIYSESLYVRVIDESGSTKYVSFISGGYDSSYYFAISGLSEGMEICLE